MVSRDEVVEHFRLFRTGWSGIGQWITEETDHRILDRLAALDSDPLSKVQLNQLLALGHEAPVSFAFLQYYWLTAPTHCYNIKTLCSFKEEWVNPDHNKNCIVSLAHLYWGLNRLFVDGLLFFGNVRSAFRALRGRRYEDLNRFFSSKRFDTPKLLARGPALALNSIAKDDRYLISEMACKSFGTNPLKSSELGNVLAEAWNQHQERGGGQIAVKELLDGSWIKSKYQDSHQQHLFSADEVLDQRVSSWEDLLRSYTEIAKRFDAARAAASKNTQLYLSMVNELDIYVATSMRTRGDFRSMGDTCERIFGSERLRQLHLRYFDPTLSAADGHEDKGLIECLMVKCAKALIYCAGTRDSYGKDAEAAMALSLGKPVIFLCDETQRSRFYRDVHPLSRLINFETGVAVGAMVTDQVSTVTDLLYRLFYNQMEFDLEQHPQRPGYIRLKERLTRSIVRLHTDDRLLAETFWNHYNRGTGTAIPEHF